MAQSLGAMKAVPLAVAGAFHTEIMRPADQRCAEALADVPMHKPRIPVISNVDALPHDDPEEIRQILVRQMLQPVRWEDSMRYLIAAGIRPVLRGRARAACFAGCCGGSIATCRARAWKCEEEQGLGIRISSRVADWPLT